MEKSKKWGIMDYYALYQLSLRDFFWRIDGRQGIKKFAHSKIGWGWYWASLVIMLYVYLLPFLILWRIITLIFGLILVLMGNTFITEIISESVSEISNYMSSYPTISNPIVGILGNLLIVFLIFDIQKLKYNLKYKSSMWYKNTGVTPREIVKDKSKGLYGEYIATISAEEHIKAAGVYGKIYNNVIIPTKDGIHAELDIVAVMETGIHVIEAKARTGFWSGNISNKNLMQNGRMTDNPILQNVNHINHLYQYLYDNLPECELKNRYILDDFVNVVLFTQTGIDADFNYGQGIVNGFIGMATSSRKWGKGYDKSINVWQKCLTKEEIDLIAQTIEPCTGYSREELAQKQTEREAIIAQREHERTMRREASIKSEEDKPYYVADVEYFTKEEGIINPTVLCWDNYNGTWYYDSRDNFYKAIPVAKKTIESKRYENEAEAMAYYLEITGKYGH